MTVVNLKHISHAEAAASVRINRRTRWADPYVIRRHGDRAAVCAAAELAPTRT